MPAGVDLAAFRIIQEALTNVTRHSGAAAALVRLAYGEKDLIVEVEDDGRGSTGAGKQGEGSGIRGMSQRADALGGELHAGPRAGGGFTVRAKLPLDPRPSRDEP